MENEPERKSKCMKANSIRTGAAVLCFFFGLVTLLAQDSQTVASVSFKQGKVWIPKDGNFVETTNAVTLPRAIWVNTNGVFTVNKGKERQLREGQTIDEDGMLISPDGSVVPVIDHLAMRAGRVQIVRDGESTGLSGEFAFPDGSRVSADGAIRTPDGRLRRMLDGQLLKLDGSSLQAIDTASLRDGKAVLYKDGGRVELRPNQVMAMSDGTRVSADGTVIRPDGARIALKEGEILKIPGVVPPRR